MQNNNPIVSIIIPTYNRSKYIKKAIESCINQTYKNIEIIIIDDFSSDNTKKIIEKFFDNRIKYYKNSSNKWPSYSRNKWLELSSWKYINFLDDDDELLPKKIEVQLQKFKTSKIKNLWAVLSWVEYKRKNKKTIELNNYSWNLYDKLLEKFYIKWILNLLIKRDFLTTIKWFDENIDYKEEYDFYLRLSSVCNFDFVDKKLSTVYDSENQLNDNFDKMIFWNNFFFKKHKNKYIKKSKKYYYKKLFLLYVNIFLLYIWKFFWKKIYFKITKILVNIKKWIKF